MPRVAMVAEAGVARVARAVSKGCGEYLQENISLPAMFSPWDAAVCPGFTHWRVFSWKTLPRWVRSPSL